MEEVKMKPWREFFEKKSDGRRGELKVNGLPTHTDTGKKLSWFGRLTYGWLGTDDHEVAKMHEEQDRKEGRW
jgi:hypothetical protein